MLYIYYIVLLKFFVLSEYISSLNITEEYLNILSKPAEQCSRGTEFHLWSFRNLSALQMRFPIDPEVQNYVREVSTVLFSVVKPTPLGNVKLAAVSNEVLATILNLNPSVKYNNTFVDFVAGNWLHPGGIYLSHRYGGHQVIR